VPTLEAMTLTPGQIDALPDYTNAQMVKALRLLMVTISANPAAEVEQFGRRWSVHNLTTLENTIAAFEKRAAADAEAAAALAGTGGYAPTVSYQEPQV